MLKSGNNIKHEEICFSVVIPLYNKANNVGRTIRSVLAQTYANYEIVVVNDGSTDNSAEVVNAIQDERIRLITKENGGVSSARNRGIQEAQYPYIAFLDADDVWESNYLETQAQMILDFPEAAMWSCAWGEETKGIKHTPKFWNTPFRGYVDDYWQSKIRGNIFCVCVCVCRRATLLEIGGYDERLRYGEDYDVAWRMILHARAAFCSEVMVWYVLDAENRAMEVRKTIPYNYKISFYCEKYTQNKLNNPDFAKHFDSWCANEAYPYLFITEYKNEAQRVIAQVNKHNLSSRERFMLANPYTYRVLQPLIKLLVKIKHLFSK